MLNVNDLRLSLLIFLRQTRFFFVFLNLCFEDLWLTAKSAIFIINHPLLKHLLCSKIEIWSGKSHPPGDPQWLGFRGEIFLQTFHFFIRGNWLISKKTLNWLGSLNNTLRNQFLILHGKGTFPGKLANSKPFLQQKLKDQLETGAISEV